MHARTQARTHTYTHVHARKCADAQEDTRTPTGSHICAHAHTRASTYGARTDVHVRLHACAQLQSLPRPRGSRGDCGRVRYVPRYRRWYLNRSTAMRGPLTQQSQRGIARTRVLARLPLRLEVRPARSVDRRGGSVNHTHRLRDTREMLPSVSSDC
eukprot:6192857-Pleurochrysis_carterae.AAC.3